MKKILPILLSLCLLLTLASCAGNKPAGTDDATDPATSAAEETTQPAAANESAANTEQTTADADTSAAEPASGETQSGEAQREETRTGETNTDEPGSTASQNAEQQSGEPQSSGRQNGETQSEKPTVAETTTAANLLQAKIKLTWMEDYRGDLDSMDYCVAVEHAQTGFVIETDRTVKDLQILLLQDADIWDDGHISFKHTVVHAFDSLTPDAPLLVHTTFFGDLPNVGVRYIDADGAEKMYAVDVSGMDGHLYLMGFVDGGAK